jgi:hypothetical protein
MKLIFLFILSFEMGLILSGHQPFWGGVLACLVTFAPATQWWFFPSFGDNILYAEWLIVCIYYFLYSSNNQIKILCSILIGMGIIGYTISLYPGLQVTLGYFVMLISIYFLIDNKKNIVSIPKYHWFVLFLSISIAICIIINWATKNLAYIQLMSDTIYPGKRFTTGGTLPWYYLCHELINIFLPFKSSGLWKNQCEASAFIIIFPIPFFVFLIAHFKRNANLVKLLLVYCLFLLSWMFIGYPNWFAKYTLMSYAEPSRVFVISFGLLSTYYLVALLANKQEEGSKMKIAIKISFLLVYLFIITFGINSEIFSSYLNSTRKIVSWTAFSCLAYMFLFSSPKKFASCLVFVCVSTSIFINPLSRGLSPIYDKELAQKIFDMENGDEGLWVADDAVLAQFVYALGEDVFNHIQYYPDYEKFRLVDPSLKYKNIYNRSAYVSANILDRGNYFAMLGPNVASIFLYMPEMDLVLNTNIKYVLTRRKIGNKHFKLFWSSEKQPLYVYIIDRLNINELQNAKEKTVFDLNNISLEPQKTLSWVDSVNGESFKNDGDSFDISKSKGFLDVQGWCVDAQNKSISGGAYFLLDGELMNDIAFLDNIPREDVAAAFSEEKYLYSGFNAFIPLGEISNGSHNVKLIILTYDKKSYYDACEFNIKIHD